MQSSSVIVCCSVSQCEAAFFSIGTVFLAFTNVKAKEAIPIEQSQKAVPITLQHTTTQHNTAFTYHPPCMDFPWYVVCCSVLQCVAAFISMGTASLAFMYDPSGIYVCMYYRYI